jgi:predicted enzyme related to lactoylglutathione lyase
MTIRYDHVGIVSRTARQNADIADFFATVLGVPVDGDAAGGYAEAHVGDGVVALHVGGRGDLGTHGGTLIHLTSDDVDSDLAAAAARGGVIIADVEDLPWGRSAYVGGPHGVVVEIYQP